MFLSNTKSSAWKQFTNLPLTSSRSLAMLRKELYWFSSRILFNNNHNNNTQNTIPYLHPILAKQLLFNHGTIYPRQASPLVCCMGFWPAYLYVDGLWKRCPIVWAAGRMTREEVFRVVEQGVTYQNITMGDKDICNTPRWCLLPPISGPTHCRWSWAPYTTIGCRS